MIFIVLVPILHFAAKVLKGAGGIVSILDLDAGGPRLPLEEFFVTLAPTALMLDVGKAEPVGTLGDLGDPPKSLDLVSRAYSKHKRNTNPNHLPARRETSAPRDKTR